MVKARRIGAYDRNSTNLMVDLERWLLTELAVTAKGEKLILPKSETEAVTTVAKFIIEPTPSTKSENNVTESEEQTSSAEPSPVPIIGVSAAGSLLLLLLVDVVIATVAVYCKCR